MSTAPEHARFGSGKAVRRVEDEALLKGSGRFTDDVSLPGQARVAFLRSPHVHARIVSIDAKAAAAMPGVLAVVTGKDLVRDGVKPIPSSADFKRPDGSRAAFPPHHALAVDVVRFVGEIVAAVIAETVAQARDATEAIDVRYEPLPAVVTLEDAMASNAPLVWPQATGNITAEASYGDAKAAANAFERAAHVVSLDLVNQRLAPSPIEPRATLASYDRATKRTTLYLSCQTPTGVRDELAEVLGVSADSLRVLVGDVGGGFGMKTNLYPEDIVLAYGSRKLGRPLKWCADRLEEFLGASHGRDLSSKAELALDRSGKILALRVMSFANVGAYATPAGVAIQVLIGPWVATSIYDIRTIDIRIQAVLTHTAPTGPYRGAGRPEAIYMIERLMDAAARKTGIDQIELRKRNMIKPEQMPYTNAIGRTYDSGQFELVTNKAVALADWNGFDKRTAASKARGKIRGRGVASFLEWTGVDLFEERVLVTVKAGTDGAGDSIEIASAAQAMGQSLATTFAQLAVDVFGVPIEKIAVVFGDTDRAQGFGSAGSRSLFVVGSAVRVAAERTVDKGRELAAHEMEAAVADIEYRDSAFAIAGTDRRIGLFDLARRQPLRQIMIDSKSAVQGPSWPNGCHICEVEVDPDTGAVVVDRYWSVSDVGRVVNPMIVIGQLEGGAAQGIGQALCEQLVHDRESGQLLSASFMDYALPRADIVRHFEMTMDESTPCLANAMGVKGVGELGTIGATPAVVNAVMDALVRASARLDGLQMPLTSERVWRALAR